MSIATFGLTNNTSPEEIDPPHSPTSESPVMKAALPAIASLNESLPVEEGKISTSPTAERANSYVLPPPPPSTKLLDPPPCVEKAMEHVDVSPPSREHSYAPILPTGECLVTRSGTVIPLPPEFLELTKNPELLSDAQPMNPGECIITQSGTVIPLPPEFLEPRNQVSRPCVLSRSDSELAVCNEDSIHRLVGEFLAREDLTIGEPIGKGYSSTVFELHLNIDQKKQVGAIKILNPDNKNKDGNVAIAARHFTKNFGDHLALPVRHPSILSPERCFYLFEGKIIENPVPNSRIIAQVLPYFEGISLKQAIQQGLSIEEIRSLAAQIAGGIAHLNASRIVHGDFHPENIMIGKDGKAVIIDFGLSHKIYKEEGVRFGKGKLVHQSPEVALNDRHTEISESWSFGIILYQMLHGGKVPFRTLDEILHLPLLIDPRTPKDLESLIRNLLTRNSKHRLPIYRAREILKKSSDTPKLKRD